MSKQEVVDVLKGLRNRINYCGCQECKDKDEQDLGDAYDRIASLREFPEEGIERLEELIKGWHNQADNARDKIAAHIRYRCAEDLEGLVDYLQRLQEVAPVEQPKGTGECQHNKGWFERHNKPPRCIACGEVVERRSGEGSYCQCPLGREIKEQRKLFICKNCNKPFNQRSGVARRDSSEGRRVYDGGEHENHLGGLRVDRRTQPDRRGAEGVWGREWRFPGRNEVVTAF